MTDKQVFVAIYTNLNDLDIFWVLYIKINQSTQLWIFVFFTVLNTKLL